MILPSWSLLNGFLPLLFSPLISLLASYMLITPRSEPPTISPLGIYSKLSHYKHAGVYFMHFELSDNLTYLSFIKRWFLSYSFSSLLPLFLDLCVQLCLFSACPVCCCFIDIFFNSACLPCHLPCPRSPRPTCEISGPRVNWNSVQVRGEVDKSEKFYLIKKIINTK